MAFTRRMFFPWFPWWYVFFLFMLRAVFPLLTLLLYLSRHLLLIVDCGYLHRLLVVVSHSCWLCFPCKLDVLDHCGIVLAMIGPRTIQGLFSPIKALVASLLHERSGWS